MGLDIMFYRVSHPRKQKKGESLNDYLWDVKHKQDKDFAKEAKEFINDWLAKSNDIESKDVAFEIRQLYFDLKGKYFAYDFELKALQGATTLKEVREWYKGVDWKYFSKPDAAYFRKVNSIYAYFSPRLVDEMCVVKKEDILDIMSKATEILKEHDEETSKELLPTQSGFFFGSTDYDEWYYEDMVNILREFGKLLKDWRDDDIVFVYMSW